MPSDGARSHPSDCQVRVAAEAYRSALDNIDPRCWSDAAITDFPRGACGHASEMLGRHLRATLGIEPEYVLRDFYAPGGAWLGGHAWLEWDGLIIDITGDQFGWDRVIVARQSARHQAGRPEVRQPLTTDDRWWGTYCARAHRAALTALASATPLDMSGGDA